MLIVQFLFTSVTYQASLVEPWFRHILSRRSRAKILMARQNETYMLPCIYRTQIQLNFLREQNFCRVDMCQAFLFDIDVYLYSLS